jgi:hypothetical protein
MSFKTIFIVPALSDIAGQCIIVEKIDAPSRVLEDYRADPYSWKQVGVMNSRGELVWFNGSHEEREEIKSCQPLMAGTTFKFPLVEVCA